ncbi:hypothetical protein PIB30_034342 [Stylosanthes scabra]|uniref:Uncharacterized protein n=1 Tax=Stylosanthes scabra TaxID=79078 RepID=A0ABU6UBI6_9FABA|nr:hypothetical protein [Stylosanthes scabra]
MGSGLSRWWKCLCDNCERMQLVTVVTPLSSSLSGKHLRHQDSIIGAILFLFLRDDRRHYSSPSIITTNTHRRERTHRVFVAEQHHRQLLNRRAPITLSHCYHRKQPQGSTSIIALATDYLRKARILCLRL